MASLPTRMPTGDITATVYVLRRHLKGRAIEYFGGPTVGWVRRLDSAAAYHTREYAEYVQHIMKGSVVVSVSLFGDSTLGGVG